MERRILVIGNDEGLKQDVETALKAEDMEVIEAFGDEALRLINDGEVDFVVIEDSSEGRDLLRKLRGISTVPVIFVGRGGEIDRIVALEMGADDYLNRPFNGKELTSRIKAIFRRIDWERKRESGKPSVMRFKDLVIDKDSYEVRVKGRPVHLTPLEFELLSFLAENEGKVFSRESLLGKLWGYDYFVDTRTVDVHIRRLRTKIEDDPSKPKYIVTVRGKGYKFVDPGRGDEGDTVRDNKEEA